MASQIDCRSTSIDLVKTHYPGAIGTTNFDHFYLTFVDRIMQGSQSLVNVSGAVGRFGATADKKRGIVKLKEATPFAEGPPEMFMGEVQLTMIASAGDCLGLSIGLVNFAPGARTHWHRHPNGQTLHVIDGTALVSTRDGSVIRAKAGETVLCPAGVDHWHGATSSEPAIHYAISAVKEESTVWYEPVSVEEYLLADEV